MPFDFLWATTNRNGDRTASAVRDYSKGLTPALVRLKVHADDFVSWPDISGRFQEWTSDHVRHLELTARRWGEKDFSRWRVRVDALPLSRVVSMEAKTLTGDWQTIGPKSCCNISCVDELGNEAPDCRGIAFGDFLYLSVKREQPGMPTAYQIKKIPLPKDDLAEVAA